MKTYLKIFLAFFSVHFLVIYIFISPSPDLPVRAAIALALSVLPMGIIYYVLHRSKTRDISELKIKIWSIAVGLLLWLGALFAAQYAMLSWTMITQCSQPLNGRVENGEAYCRCAAKKTILFAYRHVIRHVAAESIGIKPDLEDLWDGKLEPRVNAALKACFVELGDPAPLHSMENE